MKTAFNFTFQIGMEYKYSCAINAVFGSKKENSRCTEISAALLSCAKYPFNH